MQHTISIALTQYGIPLRERKPKPVTPRIGISMARKQQSQSNFTAGSPGGNGILKLAETTNNIPRHDAIKNM